MSPTVFPPRKLVNRAFLAAAIAMGLDSAIIDPTDKLLYAMLKAVTLVVGKDDFCMDYICAFREGRRRIDRIGEYSQCDGSWKQERS